MTNEEAKEHLKDILADVPNDKCIDWIEALNQAIKALEQARPKGKWKRISPARIYECTNCNQVIMTSDIDCYKYCHGCGVRMEGEE